MKTSATEKEKFRQRFVDAAAKLNSDRGFTSKDISDSLRNRGVKCGPGYVSMLRNPAQKKFPKLSLVRAIESLAGIQEVKESGKSASGGGWMLLTDEEMRIILDNRAAESVGGRVVSATLEKVPLPGPIVGPTRSPSPKGGRGGS